MRKGTAVVLAASMMVLGALPALAREGATHDRAVGEREAVDLVDRPIDRPSERPAAQPDGPTDRGVDRLVDTGAVDPRPVDVVDRPVDRVRDRESDRARDRVTDRVADRYRCVDFVTDRRCVDDRHPHVNVRHLIQRLINAGEWEKLFRLLHRLGII